MPRSSEKKRKFVMISTVAERYDIHPQTLRLYEREGLLSPSRSAGNTRLYDEDSLRRLEAILTLTRDMGINLAGVEVILRLRQEIEGLSQERDRLRRHVEVLVHESQGGVRRQHAMVRVRSGALVRIETETSTDPSSPPGSRSRGDGRED